MPKPILPSETHKQQSRYLSREIRRVIALPRQMNTAAVQKHMVDAIVLKKTEFDQIEAVEAALWLSIESAQQDGSDYTQLQKRHKGVVKAVNGIAKYFDNYTDPTNDPAVLAADASATTSTGIDQAQRETAALGDATESRPTELHTNTNGVYIYIAPLVNLREAII
jgi:hypothetical protein